MRAAWIVLWLAACGAAAPTPTATPRLVQRTTTTRVFRTLATSAASSRANRTTFTLTIDGDRASLEETEQIIDGVRSIREADAASSWRVVSNRTYRGSARAYDGATLLDLETPGQQPIHLRCATTTVVAANRRARRIPTPTNKCGDEGVWDPPTTSTVAAFVCGEATQPADDGDDDDRLVFGDAPGLEHASQHDECAPQGGGLRRI